MRGRQADINEVEEEKQDDFYGGRKPLASHCIPVRHMNKAAQYILTQNLYQPMKVGWLDGLFETVLHHVFLRDSIQAQ